MTLFQGKLSSSSSSLSSLSPGVSHASGGLPALLELMLLPGLETSDRALDRALDRSRRDVVPACTYATAANATVSIAMSPL
jgi:hypothetical protein